MDEKELSEALSRAAVEEYECPIDGYKIRYNISTQQAELDFGQHGKLKSKISLAQRDSYLKTKYWKA